MCELPEIDQMAGEAAIFVEPCARGCLERVPAAPAKVQGAGCCEPSQELPWAGHASS